jgi:hypothetical protein
MLNWLNKHFFCFLAPGTFANGDLADIFPIYVRRQRRALGGW